MESDLTVRQQFWILYIVVTPVRFFAFGVYRLLVRFFEKRAHRGWPYLDRVRFVGGVIYKQFLPILGIGALAWSLGVLSVPLYALLAVQFAMICRFEAYEVLPPGGTDSIRFDRAGALLITMLIEAAYCASVFLLSDGW